MIKLQSERKFNLPLLISQLSHHYYYHLPRLLASPSSLFPLAPPPAALIQFHSWKTMKQFSVWFHCCTSEWLMASCWSCVSHSFYFSLSAVCDKCVCVCARTDVCVSSLNKGPITWMCEIILGLVPTNQFTMICKSVEEAHSEASDTHKHTQM